MMGEGEAGEHPSSIAKIDQHPPRTFQADEEAVVTRGLPTRPGEWRLEGPYCTN